MWRHKFDAVPSTAESRRVTGTPAFSPAPVGAGRTGVQDDRARRVAWLFLEREALSLCSRPRTAMENAEKAPLHFKLIPILAPPGRNSHGIRLSRLFVGRLAQRGARPGVDVRETAIEESARCRRGAFGSQAAGTLSGSTFETNARCSSRNPIHRERPIVRLEGVQLPARGVDYPNDSPGIEQNGNFRLIGIDGGGRHGRLEYPLRVFEEEIHNPLIERDRKNSGQTSRHEEPPRQKATQDAAVPANFAPSRCQASSPGRISPSLRTPGGQHRDFSRL